MISTTNEEMLLCQFEKQSGLQKIKEIEVCVDTDSDSEDMYQECS
jgi:hypothetical protein